MNSVMMVNLVLLLLIAHYADSLPMENSSLNEPQLIRDRRTAYADDGQDCYKNFFVGKSPPTGFARACGNYKYICQKLSDDTTYFASMFDEDAGIPVFSAYFVQSADALKFKTDERKDLDETWRQEAGLALQADDAMYQGQSSYDKGHLLPVGIYSFNKDNAQSTFTYTNAVPQTTLFNRGAWRTYEGKIRDYAKTCGEDGGDLYAITGATLLAQYDDVVAAAKLLKNKIRVPRAMWTAGCCVTSSGVRSFAVVGNNRGSAKGIKMTDVTFAKLQELILEDVKAQGDRSVTSVKLFPGKSECEDRKNRVVVNRKRKPESESESESEAESGAGPSKKPRTTDSSHYAIY